MNLTFRATVRQAIDGDTVETVLDLGFHIYRVERLRLENVRAPEMRGEFKKQGKAAKRYLQKLLDTNSVWTLETKKTDKYGRYVARLYSNGIDVNNVCERYYRKRRWNLGR